MVQPEGRTGVGGLGGADYIDDAQCQRCGTCTGECPADTIQLVHYTDEQIMLPAIGGLGPFIALHEMAVAHRAADEGPRRTRWRARRDES